MLPFALKAVWFALLISGTLTSYVIMWAYARSVRSRLGPTIFCVTVTLLEGAICLGMIWRMDPYEMPRAFCLAQIAVITFGALLLTGICACFSLAITWSLLWPTDANPTARSTLKWRPLYILPLIIYPIGCTIIQMVVIVKLDAAQPSDNMHCDVNSPLWPKLLGYAGMGLVEAIPCTILAMYAVFRIFRMHKVHQRLSLDIEEERYFEVVTWDSRPSISEGVKRGRPIQKGLHRMPAAPSPHPSCHAVTTSRPPSATPGRVAASIPPPPSLPLSDSEEGNRGRKNSSSARQFHLPFESPTLSASKPSLLSTEIEKDHTRQFSGSSSTMPTFAPIENAESPRQKAPSVHTHNDDTDGDDLSDSRYDGDSELAGGPSPIVFGPNPSPKVETTSDGHSRPRGVGSSAVHLRPYHKQRSRNLLSGIWRLLLFQVGFWVIETLVSISTLICMIQGRPPMPFGSEHVSALLACWAPLLLFSHSPGVQKELLFWRRPAT